MATLEYNAFYELSDPVSPRAFRGAFDPCEMALGLSRGEAKCDRPVSITWDMGSRIPGDVIWTTFAIPLIVHSRVLDILDEHGFTGWATYPVRVQSKAGDPFQDYAGLAIIGRCDPAASGRVQRALARVNVQNLRLTRLTEVCLDCSSFKIGLPHRLPDNFETRVAAAYEAAGLPRPGHV